MGKAHSMPLKVLLFTGTRAEAGLLTPIAQACFKHPDLSPAWLASGTHLLEGFGQSKQELLATSLPIAAEVPFFQAYASHNATTKDQTLPLLTQDLGNGIAALAQALSNERPDWLVVLGDRVESFAAATAAYTLGIAICHLHGGDKIDSGHMDEGFRHTITRFAHLHCAASKGSARRLEQFGEEAWRIHLVGAPGLDRLRQAKETNQGKEKELLTQLGLQAELPFLLVIFHPTSSELEAAEQQATNLFKALDRCQHQKLLIAPNIDPGHKAIRSQVKNYQTKAKWIIKENLSTIEYAAAMSQAKLFIGNSSSGIIEAPLFDLPFIHVGKRNQGREHAGHVRFTSFESEEIYACIQELDDPQKAEAYKHLKNPYGQGNAGEKTARLLAEMIRHPEFMIKKISY